MALQIVTLGGDALGTGLAALAALRIEVFRAFPYLYDGDAAYERAYLAKFAASPGAIIVAALDGREIVGCATAAPLEQVDAAFAAPFTAAGIDTARILYCGESVLRASYRGQGIGHRFFDAREAHGRRLGCTLSAFCAVVRPGDHPLKPVDYVPLDAFWSRRGYQPASGLTTTLAWKDIDTPHETSKTMQFWTREL